MIKNISLIIFTLLSTGCIFLAAADNQQQENFITTKEKLADLIKGKIAIGSEIAEVVSFLDSNNIEHSKYVEDSRTIHAIVRNVSGRLIVKKSIQVKFIFSEEKKLYEYTVEEVFTGP